jgi:hypothetical protein
VVAVLGAVFLGGPVVGFVKARWFAAEAKAETNADDAASKDAEQVADARLDEQVTNLTAVVARAQRATGELQEAARADPEGTAPLPADSLARLRKHDDWLCEQRPALCAGRGSPSGSGTP